MIDPVVKRRRAYAMFSAQFGGGGACLSLLEDGDDLAVGKAGCLHAERSKSNLDNSTFKRDHLVGGLPFRNQLRPNVCKTPNK